MTSIYISKLRYYDFLNKSLINNNPPINNNPKSIILVILISLYHVIFYFADEIPSCKALFFNIKIHT